MEQHYSILSDRGYTSTIYSLPGNPPRRVCKAFHEECRSTHYPTEKAAYERFAAHSRPPASILKYHGVHPEIPAGLVLERADNGDLHEYLWMQRQCGKTSVEKGMLYRWASQAAVALEFAHSLGVYNSDIHCVNFFLDGELNLKVGDWAGASIDGGMSQSSYRIRHRLFSSDGTDVPTVNGIGEDTEIFALGTAMYSMASLREPWPELEEPRDVDEIKRRIREGRFPDVSGLPALGEVILKCWRVEFKSMREVKRAVEEERREVLSKLGDEAA